MESQPLKPLVARTSTTFHARYRFAHLSFPNDVQPCYSFGTSGEWSAMDRPAPSNLKSRHGLRPIGGTALGGLLCLLTTAISIGPANADGSEGSRDPACPQGSAPAREVIEVFLLPTREGGPAPSQNPSLLGTQNPVIEELGEITRRTPLKVLTDPEDTPICTVLNERFSDRLAETGYAEDRGIEYPKWDATYYKGGGFYFAILTRARVPQPEEPALRTYVLSKDHIAVFDEELREIHTYIW
jgi:hypothetical protein